MSNIEMEESFFLPYSMQILIIHVLHDPFLEMILSIKFSNVHYMIHALHDPLSFTN